jgi:L-seryl-tRNA(Ser) seleniumtransferase
LILSALETTVDIHLRNSYRGASNSTSASGKRVESNSLANRPDVPVIEMLRVSIDELRSRAKNIVSALDGLPITATIGVGRAQVGGGTLPRSMLDSITLDLTHSKLGPRDIAARLREHLVPIIGYTARGRFKLDLRTVFPPQDAELIKAIHALCA